MSETLPPLDLPVVVDDNGCWIWQKARNPNGYGRLSVRSANGGWTTRVAHRLVYETLVGQVPDGLQLDHLCRVRACCNPAHLEPVTNRENSLRGVSPWAQNARKTHCKRGHELAGWNLIVTKNPTGPGRCCRTCLYASQQRYKARKRAEAKR